MSREVISQHISSGRTTVVSVCQFWFLTCCFPGAPVGHYKSRMLDYIDPWSNLAGFFFCSLRVTAASAALASVVVQCANKKMRLGRRSFSIKSKLVKVCVNMWASPWGWGTREKGHTLRACGRRQNRPPKGSPLPHPLFQSSWAWTWSRSDPKGRSKEKKLK